MMPSSENSHFMLFLDFSFFSFLLGLILVDVASFDRNSMSCYQEAGYRGNLNKKFLTDGGLIHVFKRRVALDLTSDLEWWVLVSSFFCNFSCYVRKVDLLSIEIKLFMFQYKNYNVTVFATIVINVHCNHISRSTICFLKL